MGLFPESNKDSINQLLINVLVTDIGMLQSYLMYIIAHLFFTYFITNEYYYPIIKNRVITYIKSQLSSKSDNNELKLFENNITVESFEINYDTYKPISNAYLSTFHAFVSVIFHSLIWFQNDYSISDFTEGYTLPQYRDNDEFEMAYDKENLFWIKNSIGYLIIDMTWYLIPFQLIYRKTNDFSFISHHGAAVAIWICLSRFGFGIRSAHLIWIVTEFGTLPLNFAKITKNAMHFIANIRFKYDNNSDNCMDNGNNTNIKNTKNGKNGKNSKNSENSTGGNEEEEECDKLIKKIENMIENKLLARLSKLNKIWKIIFALEFIWARLYIVPLMFYYSVCGVYNNPDSAIPRHWKHAVFIALGAGCGVGIYWTKRLMKGVVRDIKEVLKQ